MIPLINTRLIWDIPGKIGNSRSGWFHMAADDFLAETIPESDFQAILRFYTWSPPGISLGIHQSENEIDTNVCRRLGWDVVSRPTGGRTLLHDNDLSYSVILRSNESSISQLGILYKSVATALISALSNFDIKATDSLVPSTRSLRNPTVHRAKLCISSCVRGEVTVNGIKISSAAQKIYRNSILQHGSIPLKGDITSVAGVVNVPSEKIGELELFLYNKAASLERFCDLPPSPTDLAISFSNALKKQFNMKLCPAQWSKSELISITNHRGNFDRLSVSRKAS